MRPSRSVRARLASGGGGAQVGVHPVGDHGDALGPGPHHDAVLPADLGVGDQRARAPAEGRNQQLVVPAVVPGKDVRHRELLAAGNHDQRGHLGGQRNRELAVEQQRQAVPLGIPRCGDLVPAKPGLVLEDDVGAGKVGEDLPLGGVAVEQVVLHPARVGQQPADHALGEHRHSTRRGDVAEHDADPGRSGHRARVRPVMGRPSARRRARRGRPARSRHTGR